MYKEKYLKYKTKYLELKNQLDGISNTIQEGGGWFWPWASSTQDDPNIEIEIKGTRLTIKDKQNNVNLIIGRTHQYVSIEISPGNFKEMDTNYEEIISQFIDTNKLIYKNLFQIAIKKLNKVDDKVPISRLNECITYINQHMLNQHMLTLNKGDPVIIRNEIKFNQLIIEDNINKIILNINYKLGEIKVIDSNNKTHLIYKFNIEVSNSLNLDGDNWLVQTRLSLRPIYKKLIQIAIYELENNTSVRTVVKTSCIKKLNDYIRLLA
jgi:hypothetical protein